MTPSYRAPAQGAQRAVRARKTRLDARASLSYARMAVSYLKTPISLAKADLPARVLHEAPVRIRIGEGPCRFPLAMFPLWFLPFLRPPSCTISRMENELGSAEAPEATTSSQPRKPAYDL